MERILVKYPSRGRPKLLIKALSETIARAKDNSRITYLLTLDTNDKATQGEAFESVINKLKRVANIEIIRGTSSGKIHACNRDMSRAPQDWDIVLLLSDDMLCQAHGWDQRILDDMDKYFPDGDGSLWYNDGFTGDKLVTMVIYGRQYFERFRYLYHPSYKSLWSDNEQMLVGKALKKIKYFNDVLFKHNHPANTGIQEAVDHVYQINDRYYEEDRRNFIKRQGLNFGL